MKNPKSEIDNPKSNGEMAERFKAAVLKTVERKLRGFESLSLRQINISTKYKVQRGTAYTKIFFTLN